MEKRTLCARVVAVRLLSAAIAASAVVAQTSPAWAQTEMERAGAREAAKEGAKAFGEKRWSEAVDLFTRAESLVHAPPHLLYIARASVNMGQLVKARENYLKITREKIPANAPKAFVEAQENANNEITALDPRVPSVRASVSGAEGKPIKLLMDGKEVPSALVGLTMPVDPGEHLFKASAEGMASDERRVTVREGSKEAFALVLKTVPGGSAATTAAAATPAPGQTGAAAPTTTGGSQPANPVPAAEQKSGGGSGLAIAGFTVAGLGLVGVGAGVLLMSSSSSKKTDADALYTAYGCPPTAPGRCTEQNQAEISDLDNQSKTASTISTIAFIGGGAFVVGGVVMAVVGLVNGKEKPAEPAKSASITPVFGPGSIGLYGQF
jgi:hypothetical protein